MGQLEILKAPDKYQKFRLTVDGLFYDLKFNLHKQMQGILDKYEKEESETNIIWTFKGLYEDKEVVHQFVFWKENSAVDIRTYLGGRKHAEVELVPQTKFAFYSNYLLNMTKTVFGY